MREGRLTARDYAEALIDVIETREPETLAFAQFDAGHVRRAADACDRTSPDPDRPLHGLPVGIKDIIDTADLPTENGTPADLGRRPERDAEVVRRLKTAGGLVMGKTVTTELAYLHPSRTKNPRNLGHTPGGSSSGSAAAVAAGMIPLAIGTQTGGSVIRPAAFCGVVGYKPTFGAIPRGGVLNQSQSLDTIGVFARTPEDAALLAAALIGPDASDPYSVDVEAPDPESASGAAPRLRFVRPPGWTTVADPEMKAALTEFIETLPDCATVPLPASFDQIVDLRACVNHYEMAANFTRYLARTDALSDTMREVLKKGASISEADYRAALDARRGLRNELDKVFGDADVLLAPAAPGPAPRGFATTGDSIFNGLWTYLGTPALTLPLLTAKNGLPMGVQLIGRPGDDARLFRAARWLWARSSHT